VSELKALRMCFTGCWTENSNQCGKKKGKNVAVSETLHEAQIWREGI